MLVPLSQVSVERAAGISGQSISGPSVESHRSPQSYLLYLWSVQCAVCQARAVPSDDPSHSSQWKMNFFNFSVKYGRGRKGGKVYDDRPFNCLLNSSEPEKLRLVAAASGQLSEEESEINFNPNNTDYDFKSFNHYFDEPIYTEPDCKEVTGNHDVIDLMKPSPLYDLLSITAGRYQCRALSSDSDYESYSVDKVELDNTNSGNIQPNYYL